MDVSCTVFEILTRKATKWLVLDLHTPLWFDASAQRNPSGFLDDIYPAKTRGMRLGLR